jgi:Uma2 family endonuclease
VDGGGFLAWAARQEARYEFDGVRPVAMVGGTRNHNRIMTNIHAALRARLRGSPCAYYGPDLGVSTIGQKIRYPDALVTCSKFPGDARVAPDVVIVFEVLSAELGRRDRIEKVREYAAVGSIGRYVIVESDTSGLLVLYRASGGDDWVAESMTVLDTLHLPEIGISIPVLEFYDDVELPLDEPEA